MSQREIIEPTVTEHGDETHPAFGQITASRGTYGGKDAGAVLFDSDIRHGQTVTITVTEAKRRRSNNHDYVLGGIKPLIVVEMSEAQWASFVSSMNTSGVPCTVRQTQTDWQIPGLPYAPRLAQSMTEVREAAARSFAEIVEAMDALDALDSKAPAKARKEALQTLRARINNAQPNVDFAATSLNKHTENVVQKARADIEAMVQAEATRLQLNAAQTREVLALPAMPGEEQA